MTDNEASARELLAAEYERSWWPELAAGCGLTPEVRRAGEKPQLGETVIRPRLHRTVSAVGGEAMKEPYYKTHEPPHCPTCDCGADPSEMERLRRNSERYEFIKKWARVLDRVNRYEIGISTPSWNAPHGCSFDEGLDAWMRE